MKLLQQKFLDSVTSLSRVALSVGFDRQIFAFQPRGGISRYFAELIYGLNFCNDVTASCAFRFHRNVHLHEQGLENVQSNKFLRLLPKIGGLCKSRSESLHGYDIVHATFTSGSPYRLKNSKLVCSLFDMIPERYPLLFSRRNPHLNKREWFEHADLILSISNSAADDLEFFQPQLTTPIKVIHLGTSIHQVMPRFPHEINFPFLLFVGKRVFYKNFQILLIALSRLPLKSRPHLICAGGQPFGLQELKILNKLQLYNHVHQFSATDFELAWLYRNAQALLVPSMAEGFSLPLIEAFACNTPVICSDIEVHREVGGEFASFLPGLNGNAWADCLRTLSIESLTRPRQALGDNHYLKLLEYYSQARLSMEHSLAYHLLLG